jgi:PAS domain S-box-containing protein
MLSWNKGATVIFGYEEYEVLGKPLTLLMPERYREPHRQGLKRLKTTGESRVLGTTIELHGLRKDGREFPLDLSLSSWKIADETFYSAIVRDITDRKRAEAELERRSSQLELANKELEAFSYSVSHDLRAPLRHIDGFADLLRKHCHDSLDDKGRHFLATISESAKHMGRLIDDLLAFSRAGRTELHGATVNLSQLVKDVLQDLKHETEGRAIEWTVDELPSVHGDSSMLRQVLMNLIGNAIKYTRTRSRVRIEIGGRIDRSAVYDELTVFVRDNGVGFDMRYVDKLFGVFQRLHSVSEFEGTGIGLANVRRIIARHGGRTWAEGAVDRGATFYFSLPLAKEAGHDD